MNEIWLKIAILLLAKLAVLLASFGMYNPQFLSIMGSKPKKGLKV